MANKPRPSTGRSDGPKGPKKGSGGKNRRKLAGRGPTPRAEDRVHHPAYKGGQSGKSSGRPPSGKAQSGKRGSKASRTSNEVIAGRNSVVEALREKIPATALYVGQKDDDRVKESIDLAGNRGISLLEASTLDLDRLTGGANHQGIALQVPPYDYAHPDDLPERAASRQETPLIVALDGITDPRNLGAIIRSTAAFGGHGVVVPERRAAGMTASAWKTAAGAAARIPVAKATNLTRTLTGFKSQGLFVLGLDGAGDVSLPDAALGNEPIVIVVGSEGKGLSRLVAETCDQIVSVPIDSATESLNAGIAAAVSLYEVSRIRSR